MWFLVEVFEMFTEFAHKAFSNIHLYLQFSLQFLDLVPFVELQQFLDDVHLLRGDLNVFLMPSKVEKRERDREIK